MMRARLSFFVVMVVALLLSPLFTSGQENKTTQLEQSEKQQKGIAVDEVIQRFAANETKSKQVRDKYIYREDITVETLNGNRVDGEFHSVVDITFDDRGRRKERVVVPPRSTLRRVLLTKEDFESFRQEPFVLTSDVIAEYKIVYVGTEEENATRFYVFDVAPQRIRGNKPRFQGRIWVDDHNFQIVKTYGNTMLNVRNGEAENLFPAVTTLREQVDGEYYFPAYSQADEELHFSNETVHVRQVIKYSNYRSVGATAHP
jgi:outer membrane lipoprotein-sorting protein